VNNKSIHSESFDKGNYQRHARNAIIYNISYFKTNQRY